MYNVDMARAASDNGVVRCGAVRCDERAHPTANLLHLRRVAAGGTWVALPDCCV